MRPIAPAADNVEEKRRQASLRASDCARAYQTSRAGRTVNLRGYQAPDTIALSIPDGGFVSALLMVRIFFSEPLAELRHVVPLAQACGVGRADPAEPALAKLFAEAPSLWQASRIEEAQLACWSN